MKYIIEFNGTSKRQPEGDAPIVSMNKLYASPNWRVRNKIKDLYHEIFSNKIREAFMDKMESFDLRIEYNNGMDVDNLVIMGKLLVDAMRKEGIVKDDTPVYYKSLSIQFNKELPKNKVLFYINGEEE